MGPEKKVVPVSMGPVQRPRGGDAACKGPGVGDVAVQRPGDSVGFSMLCGWSRGRGEGGAPGLGGQACGTRVTVAEAMGMAARARWGPDGVEIGRGGRGPESMLACPCQQYRCLEFLKRPADVARRRTQPGGSQGGPSGVRVQLHGRMWFRDTGRDVRIGRLLSTSHAVGRGWRERP